MKKFFGLFALLFVGSAFALPTNIVVFNFSDFEQVPQGVRQLDVYRLATPFTNGAGTVITIDKKTKVTATNGTVRLTNIYDGPYMTVLLGTSAKTTNWFVFPVTNGTINASDWVTNASGTVVFTAGYSQSAADARFANRSLSNLTSFGTNVIISIGGGGGGSAGAISNNFGRGTNTILVRATNYFSTTPLFREPFWGVNDASEFSFNWIDNTSGSNRTLLQTFTKTPPAGNILYWGNNRYHAQSIRASDCTNGVNIPRITIAFMDDDGTGEESTTFAFHTNDLRAGGYKFTPNTVFSFSETTPHLTFGDTNGSHIVRGSNVVFQAGQTPVEAARIWTTKGIQFEDGITNRNLKGFTSYGANGTTPLNFMYYDDTEGDEENLVLGQNNHTTINKGYLNLQQFSTGARTSVAGFDASGGVGKIVIGTGLTLNPVTSTLSASGGGDVVGPAASTDDAIARFDGTTGKLLQSSSGASTAATIDDSGNMGVPGSLQVSNTATLRGSLIVAGQTVMTNALQVQTTLTVGTNGPIHSTNSVQFSTVGNRKGWEIVGGASGTGSNYVNMPMFTQSITNAGAAQFGSSGATIITPSGGQVRVTGAANTTTLRLDSSSPSAGQSFGMLLIAGGNSSDYAMSVTDRASNPLFQIRGDGNVGVGTDTPGVKLAVNGVTASTNGVASLATTAAATIDATGWTNTFGVNATVYVTATAVAWTIKNRADATIYTSPTLTATVSVNLQPGWSVNAASGLAGTALPW